MSGINSQIVPFLERRVETPEEMQAFAAALAGYCRIGDCITLSGDLGAGKTTFAQGFVRALAGEGGEVTSPTFTLVQNYEVMAAGVPTSLWHCDLYRLKQPAELDELGLEEAFGGALTLIEWPEIAAALLPAARLAIRIEGEGQGRILRFYGDEQWVMRLTNLIEGI